MTAECRELVRALSSISLSERDTTSSDNEKVREMARVARLALRSVRESVEEAQEQDELRLSTLWQERNRAIRDAAFVRTERVPLLEAAEKLRAALKLLWEEANDESRCPHAHLSEPCRKLVNEALKESET